MIITLDKNLKRQKPVYSLPTLENVIDGFNPSFKRSYDYKTGRYTSTTDHEFGMTSLMDDAEIYNKGYLKYIEHCWNYHRGVIITPDHIWHILLSELAQVIINDPESYRDLFTDSPDKKTIICMASDKYHFPVDEICAVLKTLVPTDTDLFLPHFSCTTPEAHFCKQVTFAELCSPYYSYMTTCCGIPFVDIHGTEDDWKLVFHNWRVIVSIMRKQNPGFEDGGWYNRTLETLDLLIENINSSSFWKDMFKVEHCGSGGDRYFGWILRLYFCNMDGQQGTIDCVNQCINEITWTWIPENAKMDMKSGILWSKDSGDFCDPQWGYVVWQDMKGPSNE